VDTLIRVEQNLEPCRSLHASGSSMPQRTERNPPSLPAPPKGIDIWGKASPAWHRTTLNNLLPSPPSRAFLYGGKQRSRSQRMMPHAREREGQPRTRISVQRDEPTPVLVHTVPTPTACHSKASFNNAWLVCVRLACLLRVSFVDLTGVSSTLPRSRVFTGSSQLDIDKNTTQGNNLAS